MRVVVASTVLIAALVAGCSDTAAPPRTPLVAVAGIEVVSLHATNPDPGYHATCQTGAGVWLSAAGSHDPGGQPLTYQWTDTCDGRPTPDFGPGGPIRTSALRAGALLGSIGAHEIHLSVEAPDGRKATTSLFVLVTPCESCKAR